MEKQFKSGVREARGDSPCFCCICRPMVVTCRSAPRVFVSQVYTTADGSTSSRLKQVDDKWIVARLERWGAQARSGSRLASPAPPPCPLQLQAGRYASTLIAPPLHLLSQDQLPMVGPKKGAIVQDLVREHKPRRVLEARRLLSALRAATRQIDSEEGAQHPCFAPQVGTFLGYSAILMAQALPEGGKVFTLEQDWKFVLAARRFLWQCNQARLRVSSHRQVHQHRLRCS